MLILPNWISELQQLLKGRLAYLASTVESCNHSVGVYRSSFILYAYVESVRLHATELKQYLPRWWRDGVTTCRQSPVTLTSPDGLNLHTCHHFAPSRWRYRRYLHSPGELETTQNATVLRNERRDRAEVCRALQNEGRGSEGFGPLFVRPAKVLC